MDIFQPFCLTVIGWRPLHALTACRCLCLSLKPPDSLPNVACLQSVFFVFKFFPACYCMLTASCHACIPTASCYACIPLPLPFFKGNLQPACPSLTPMIFLFQPVCLTAIACRPLHAWPAYITALAILSACSPASLLACWLSCLLCQAYFSCYNTVDKLLIW